MDYEKKEGKYSCDLLLSVEIKDSQKRTLVRKEEPFSQVLTKEKLKRMIADKMQIHKELELDIAPESKFIYVSVIDNVTGKKLRKLFRINF